MENGLVRTVEEVEVSRRTPRFVSRVIQVYTETARDNEDTDTAIEGMPYNPGLLGVLVSYFKKIFLPHVKVDLRISIAESNRKVYS